MAPQTADWSSMSPEEKAKRLKNMSDEELEAAFAAMSPEERAKAKAAMLKNCTNPDQKKEEFNKMPPAEKVACFDAMIACPERCFAAC